jgi:3-dehydroquinate dehydratase-2
MKILILNGPNLNLLGKREPSIYGNEDFETYFSQLQFGFKDLELGYEQSNIEGELIDHLHRAEGNGFNAVILNAGAYTHTSIAIGDAVAGITLPVIEVHISNVMNREGFRHVSYISKHAAGVISGFGLKGYALALQYFVF